MMLFQLGHFALADLEDSVAYLAEDSESAAHRLVDELEFGFGFLGERPQCGHRRPDLTSAPLLFWTVAGYLIASLLDPAPVTIVAILHGSRDAASILQSRFA